MKNRTSSGSLKKATRFFNAKKYGEVVRVLEPEIFKYRESITYFKLLGISCVYSDDIGGATSYLSRALQLDKDDVDSLLGLAIIALKRMKPEEAIKHWLSVLEIQPGNKQANLGLALLRNNLDPEKLLDFVESGRIYSVYPKSKSNRGVKILVGGLVLILLSSVIMVLSMYLPGIPQKALRPEFDKYELPADASELTEVQGVFRYILSNQDVKNGFGLAKKYFLNYRDNLALVEINRLVNSNALPGIKNIALSMKEHTATPDFSTIKDIFPLGKVMMDPFLYDGCNIKWIGRVGSLSITKTKISFYLWVGSDKEFEGVVPASVVFPVELKNGQSIELLGTIGLDQGKINLKGIAIHKIVTGNS
jgi:tetratricopeptide (TPR) repeat protein